MSEERVRAFMRLANHRDRNDGPSELYYAFIEGRIRREDLAANEALGSDIEGLMEIGVPLIVSIWDAAERPQAHLGVDLWSTLFGLAALPKPAEPLTLFRGAVPRHARGMSWTPDRALAEWFAHRFDALSPGFVYVVEAPPAAVLWAGTNGRKEQEVIVDPRLLPRLRRAP